MQQVVNQSQKGLIDRFVANWHHSDVAEVAAWARPTTSERRRRSTGFIMRGIALQTCSSISHAPLDCKWGYQYGVAPDLDQATCQQVYHLRQLLKVLPLLSLSFNMSLIQKVGPECYNNHHLVQNALYPKMQGLFTNTHFAPQVKIKSASDPTPNRSPLAQI